MTAPNMRISILARENDRNVNPVDATWDQLVAWLTSSSLEVQDRAHRSRICALWSPIVWRDYAKKINAQTVEPVLVLDFDKISWARMIQVLADLSTRGGRGLDFLWHTTFRYSGPDENGQLSGEARARVVIRCSRRIEAHEYERFWERAVYLLGLSGLIDSSCRGLDRAYFVPCHRVGVTPESGIHEGEPLDVDECLRVSLPSVQFESAPEDVGALEAPRDALHDLAVRLRRGKSGDRKLLGHYLQLVYKGESFAVSGNRDNVIFRLACLLAEEFPNASARSLAEHFRQSLQIMGSDAPTVASVEEKIGRKQREHKASLHSDNKDLTLRIKEALGGERITPYSPEELERFASEGGDLSGPLEHRWVLSDGTSAFFFVNGDYVQSRASALVTAARTYLAPAISAGVRVQESTPSGIRDKSPEALLREYGQILRGIEYDLTASRTYFDRERGVLSLVATPPREIAAKHHPEIAQWLEELCGTQLDYVLDWLATVRKLDQPAPALLVYGESGAGKNLLAYGIARLWSERGPTDLDAIMGSSFNESILHCPLVYGDEKVPTNAAGRADTESLRKLITADSFSLRQKYLSEARILGSIRLVIGVQSLDKVFQEHEMGANDIRAIADRFIVIKATEGARAMLRAGGGRVMTEPWVLGDQMAEHVLWLEQTRRPRVGERLIVPGNAGELVSYLQVDTGIRWCICHWIYEFLKDPTRHRGLANGRLAVRVERMQEITPLSGRFVHAISVNPKRLLECWNHYLPASAREPSLEKVSKTIRELGGRSSHGFRSIEPRVLFDWARSQGEHEEPIVEAYENGLPAEKELALGRSGTGGAFSVSN